MEVHQRNAFLNVFFESPISKNLDILFFTHMNLLDCQYIPVPVEWHPKGRHSKALNAVLLGAIQPERV
jgi:hypothetical protein